MIKCENNLIELSEIIQDILDTYLDVKLHKFRNNIKSLICENRNSIENLEMLLAKSQINNTDWMTMPLYDILRVKLSSIHKFDNVFSNGFSLPINCTNEYGRWFEKEILKVLKNEGFEILKSKKSKADAIIKYNDMKFIFEIKSRRSNSEDQASKYCKIENADGYFSLNGNCDINLSLTYDDISIKFLEYHVNEIIKSYLNVVVDYSFDNVKTVEIGEIKVVEYKEGK